MAYSSKLLNRLTGLNVRFFSKLYFSGFSPNFSIIQFAYSHPFIPSFVWYYPRPWPPTLATLTVRWRPSPLSSVLSAYQSSVSLIRSTGSSISRYGTLVFPRDNRNMCFFSHNQVKEIEPKIENIVCQNIPYTPTDLETLNFLL